MDSRFLPYLTILREELLPAMGCTEPISLAYAAAKARETLGFPPESIAVEVSDNILKNAKSAVVPGTGGLRGIEAAVAAGVVAGRSHAVLEVIAHLGDEHQAALRECLRRPITVLPSPSGLVFDLAVTVVAGGDWAKVRISHFHSNIVVVERNGISLLEVPDCSDAPAVAHADRSVLSVEGIVEFAETVPLDDIAPLLDRQIACNSAIADEGLAHPWGANIGKVLLRSRGSGVSVRARARAAAGSDARMSGCSLPVIIVSGSGNQGIAASVPVVEYARELKSDHETLLRALAVSNLVTIHQKTGIGRLSAYCGAVSAGCGAGAGVAWLHGGQVEEIAHTVVNALAIVSGMVCDGAKPSCAAKIAASVDAGILGFEMHQHGQQFYSGDGLVAKGVERTIANFSRLGREGMKETDKEILRMMLEE